MKQVSIVVVDDNPIDRAFIKTALNELPSCQVYEFESCLDVMGFLEKNSIDLMILDYLMPDISGLEMLKRVRKVYSQVEFPVVMVTSMEESEGVTECFHAGANDYVTKPVLKEVIVARVNSLLTLKRLNMEASELSSKRALTTLMITLNHEINIFFNLSRE